MPKLPLTQIVGWQFSTLGMSTENKKLGNVNECRTALVKNLIKESFYRKRKKSN